jgi:hypothetical protein
VDARALVAELRERTLDELDYRAEAERQRAFAAAFSGSDRLLVPRVVASAPKVLVSEWVDGVALGALTRRPAADADEQARRDRLAHTVVEALFSSPARVGMLHADPHPGNFLTLRDGRLAMIDYGAVATLPDGVPPVLTGILRHVADGEPEPMMRLLRAEGFVAGDVAPEEVLGYLGGVGDPLRVERFHFDRAWMRGQGARIVRDERSRRTGRADAARTAPPGRTGVVRLDEHPRPDRLHGGRARARRAVAARVRDAPYSSASVSGRKTRKRVSPGSDATCTSPWCLLTITR